MDIEKRKVCQNQNIKLIELNYSQDKYLNKNKIEERLNEIRNIMEEEVGLDPKTLN